AVTVTAPSGTVGDRSDATAVVVAPPDPPVVSVTIQGEAVVGGTLDAVVVTDAVDPTIAYQWARCDAVDTNQCEDIPGAAAPSYAIADADLGYRLRVAVTVTAPSGTVGG